MKGYVRHRARCGVPGDDWATLGAQTGGEHVLTAWHTRRAALTAYRDHLARQRDPCPSCGPCSTCITFAHSASPPTASASPTAWPAPWPCARWPATGRRTRERPDPNPCDDLRHRPGQSLAQGAAGTALLHIERAHLGAGRWRTAHSWVTEATRDAVEVYHAAGQAALHAQAITRDWFAIRIQPADGDTAEHAAATHLGPQLQQAQATGVLAAWWFVRKHPCWRLRLHPGPIATVTELEMAFGTILDSLKEAGLIDRWWPAVYEPEVLAFGGPRAMSIAHNLFHTDSHSILDYVLHQDPAARPEHTLGRRELSVLLCSALFRAAGQEWYEQGDIWDRVARMRPLPSGVPTNRLPDMAEDLRRLMAVDTAQLLETTPLGFAAPWAVGFRDAGSDLADAAHHGALLRGMRDVLAHHVIFHWNRLGLAARTQAILARAARDTVMNPPNSLPGARPAEGAVDVVSGVQQRRPVRVRRRRHRSADHRRAGRLAGEGNNVIDWQSRAATYADQLAADGAITDPAWQKAFATTPRHLFVPSYWALDEYNSPATLIDGTDPDQRDTWLVTSIDIDPELIDQADTSLHAGGYRPRLHTGDGGAGLADAAPFDRIIATCSVDRIPPAWVDQLTPGGRLVVPLSFGGALAVLDKTGDNELGGRIDPFAVYFMPLRDSADQPTPASIAPDLPDDGPVGARHDGLTGVDPRALEDPDFRLWLSLHLPGVHFAPAYEDGRQTEIIVYTARHRATCAHQATGDGLWPITQNGHRPWDTVETAWRAWERNGRPPRDRLGITVNGDGRQHVWLDEPTSRQTWPMPTI